jgi:predicted DNA-binding transcriptional regulator YafY
MADTSSRTLALLALFEARRSWSGAELCDRLEVSPRTLRRDVERLRSLGYPVEAARGVGGHYRLGAGAVLPPLVLDDDEAVALVAALQSAADSAVDGVADAALRALAKTLALMPPHLRSQADALRAVTVAAAWGHAVPTVDSAVLQTVAGACRDEVRVAFGYVARDGAATKRYVEPYRLVVLDSRWYLVAYDVDRSDWRTFRLDRIGDCRATVGRFDPRALPGDPAELVREGIRSSGRAPIVVRLVVEADATSVTAAIGRWARVRPAGRGRCHVEMEADDLRWPLMAIDRLDADFTVEAPAELRDLLRARARRYRRAVASAR